MNVLLMIWLVCCGVQADAPANVDDAPAAAAAATAAETPAVLESSVAAPPESEAESPPPLQQTPVGDPAAGTAAPPIITPGPGASTVKSPPANPAPGPEGIIPGTSIPSGSGEVKVEPVSSTKEALLALLALLKVAAILGLPFLLARLICNALRVREFSTRMGIVFFALTLGAAPFVSVISEGRPWTDAVRLGIDLAGGTNMVFEVDRDAARALNKEITGATMDSMLTAVERRINPGGTEEITLRRVGSDRIEVIIPKATQERVESIKRRIVDLGSLEFDILANVHDHVELIQLAQPTRDNPAVTDIRDASGRLVAKWRPVATNPQTGQLKEVGGDQDHYPPRIVERGGKSFTEFLLVVEPVEERRITGKYLQRVQEGMSDQGLAVNFTFSQTGGYMFQNLTSRYQPREGSHHCRLAILLNEEIHSAPTINAVIGSQGQITGQFDQQEVEELVSVLNAGALDVPLKRDPVNEFTVSPLLGIDIQTKGYRAMILSGLSVFVVMLLYYWKLGVVANLCMAANVILLMGIMSLINATFTLPGLAGIVLTIGMSVDANVLIYERFREERARGSSLRMTIQNGFHKALSSIVDSNLTTLITAVVLYVVGTSQVRGFAVALFIGIVVSMFTALYMGRLLFDLAERKRWLKDMRMMQAIGETHIPFSKYNKLFAGISCTLIVLGIGLVALRGKDNLDIDFRGGSMATFTFDGAPPTLSEMQTRLDAAFDETVQLEELQTGGEQSQTLIRIRSTKDKEEEISKLVAQAFADAPQQLSHQEVTIGAARAIPLEPATDYAGGNEVDLSLKVDSSATTIKDALAEQLGLLTNENGGARYPEPGNLLEVQMEGDTRSNAAVVRTRPEVTAQDLQAAIASYQQLVLTRPLFEELSTFDQAVAGETQWIAFTAVMISLLATIAYLWFRFQAVDFGIAAVVGVAHDILAVIGLCTLASLASYTSIGKALGLIDFKINLSMIAAYLTIVGYSLNDTIVVFDRIRELRGKSPTVTSQLVDQALNQTLSRTVLTGVTTLIVIFIMYSIGGEGLRGFSFSLFMGIIVGTYSTLFIASPTLVWLMARKHATSARTSGAAWGQRAAGA
ncbi:MAG: protein translocase subunit SecD [Planctomyces sp.]|nr:protein translocase subunit SecD [Planctomyces sp.]